MKLLTLESLLDNFEKEQNSLQRYQLYLFLNVTKEMQFWKRDFYYYKKF